MYVLLLQAQFDEQLKPLTSHLAKIGSLKPPDFGSLEEWKIHRRALKAAAEKRAAARQAAQASGTGLAGDMYNEETEVQVLLPGEFWLMTPPSCGADQTS